MLNSLSHGVKISITRSITTAFEQYMAKIMWDEESYHPQDFMKEWQRYIQQNASWFNQVPDDMKLDPRFHEDLAQKINEVVDKIFSEEPTPDQIKTIDSLQKELGTNYDFSCKAEARFYIDFLTNSIKKKPNS
ncbi:hypothetical protein BTO30_01665 [Domibacillus antri]|uniref:Uncharacterized protein n=1 Tax=Domibacillus antri TaxID=1714264 RepID=A0A1Q8QA84_9BACI|nr:hypothetical protein [Domibacillus antri]OLN24248.1 hypothetical protein BTO30_01665 [Domibacillus antri]